MSQEEASVEYYKHLLNALTLNSRALITELTGLAEKCIDDANSIVGATEDRIVRILPKYKLYSFYLMDSIVKNIGNPYNLLFAKNLYKNFTETYLIVTDTMTRQHLINLFKTWLTGKTSAGLDLFPAEILAKIEQFIIKATSLNSATDEPPKVSRDTLLREGNYLLQYVIALDDALDKHFQNRAASSLEKDTLRKCHQTRNALIQDINSISESVMTEVKPEFERKSEHYAAELQRIRRTLDDQSFQQKELLHAAAAPAQPAQHNVEIEINLDPKHVDVLMVLGDTVDDQFEQFVSQWGKSIVDAESANFEENQNQGDVIAQPVSPPAQQQSLAGSLGLNMAAFNFQDSLLDSPKNELLHISLATSLDDMDEDGYDPEESMVQPEFELQSPQSPRSPPLHSPSSSVGVFAGKSSLKRPGSGNDRVVKRVRFDV